MPIIKDYFPGGNTGEGFFSYYDYVIGNDANRIFLLKGGPGTGKSSLMKDIGREFFKRGFDIEYHHCSSDNNSIDATSPHTIAAKNPGVVDEIINLGEFWDVKKMEENKEKVIPLTKDVSRSFKRVYKYLKAAKLVLEDTMELNSSFMDFGQINLKTNEFISEIFMGHTYSDKLGKARHLFGSAYTPGGFVSCTESVLSNSTQIHSISGDIGTGKTTILEKIYKSAIEKGLDVEVLHTPLMPEKIETVFIKDIKVGITIDEKFIDENKTLNLNKYRDEEKYKPYKKIIEEDKNVSNDLIKKAVENIKHSKALHDELEKFYVDNIDFTKSDILKNQLIKRIEEYIK